MFGRLARLWKKRRPAAVEDLAVLLRERRRLNETLESYREFGFDALVPDLRARIGALDSRIRQARQSRRRPRS